MGLDFCGALLLARHFMHRRIYQYSSVKAYNFHLCRYMVAHYSNSIDRLEDFLFFTDTDVISSLYRAAKDPKLPGHPDAKCVIFRSARFRAIALPDRIKEKDLLEFKANNKLPDLQIDWEFNQEEVYEERLSFPVSRRHLVIEKAKDCSDLLLKVPTKKINWVFISPDRDLDLVHFLEKS